jgi:transcriptional regulator with XRE-family HTH domain
MATGQDGALQADLDITSVLFDALQGSVTQVRERTLESRLGERLRSIRHRRRATLRAVADRAAISESFLSQIERGRAGASIATLQRIAGALGVSVSDLFEPDGTRARPRVLPRESRPTLAFGVRGRKFLLTPRPLENLEVFVAELDAGGATAEEQYTHGDSEELVVCLSGTIELYLGAEVHELEAGDSIDYRSSVPHRVVNREEETAEVMWVISPPSL